MKNSIEHDVATECLEFMFEYYTIVRKHIVEENNVRFHSHSFYLLNILSCNKDNPLTMTACAKKMNITKQQLTKLADMHEANGHVVRICDEFNRRQIKLQITPQGEKYFERLKSVIIAEIIGMLDKCSAKEKNEIQNCVKKLSVIMKKYE